LNYESIARSIRLSKSLARFFILLSLLPESESALSTDERRFIELRGVNPPTMNAEAR